jgi:hypothetical protein
MKMALIITILVFCVTSLIAQEVEKKHDKELYFSITKHNATYKYFSIYDGYGGASLGFRYGINEKFHLVGEYNYGFMRNNHVKANATDHTLNIGIDFTFINKEKFKSTIFAGTGFELIWIKPIIEGYDFKSHLYSMGIPLMTNLRFSYALNDKINLFVNGKLWYSFMINDIRTKNNLEIIYYTNMFFSYGIGMSYMF